MGGWKNSVVLMVCLVIFGKNILSRGIISIDKKLENTLGLIVMKIVWFMHIVFKNCYSFQSVVQSEVELFINNWHS